MDTYPGDELAETIRRLRQMRTDTLDVEAKRSANELPKSCRETISAFSNSAGGGVLILGATEAEGFAATGVQDAKRIAANLASSCADDFEPPIRPVIRIHQFEGVDLIVGRVSRTRCGTEAVLLQATGDGERRVRSHPTTATTA